MRTDLFNDEYIGLLTNEKIKKFLLDRNWQPSRDEMSPYELFFNYSESGAEYVVALNDDDNKVRAKKEAIETIASFYLLEPEAAAVAITGYRQVPPDMLFVSSFAGEDVSSIPIDSALATIQSVSDLIKYSACAEKEVKMFYKKSSGLALKYAASCKFSHTYRGSLGFSFECPMPPQPAQKELFNPEELPEGVTPPLERKVTRRIIKGWQVLKESINQNAVSIIVDNYDTALNANMCDALFDMASVSDCRDTAFRWMLSPAIQDDTYRIPPEIIKIKNGQALDFLAEASRQLNPHTPREDETRSRQKITGYVVRLESYEAYPEAKKQGNSIIIVQPDSDNENRRINVRLERNEYLLAVDAHSDEQLISIDGFLEKRGQSWFLTDPNHFKIEKSNY